MGVIIVLNSKFEEQADPEEPGSDIEDGWRLLEESTDSIRRRRRNYERIPS